MTYNENLLTESYQKEIIRLKNKISELEMKLYGCTEEEYLKKELIKEIKSEVFICIYKCQPIEKENLDKLFLEYDKDLYCKSLEELVEIGQVLIENDKYVVSCKLFHNGAFHNVYRKVLNNKFVCSNCGRQ